MKSKIMLKIRKFLPFLRFLQIISFLEFVCKIAFKYRGLEFLHCYSVAGLVVGACYKITNPSVKIIYDAREYETETLGLSGMRQKVIKFLEKNLIKYSYSVITVSDSIAKQYSTLYNIPKPYIVLNCPPKSEINKRDLFRQKFSIPKDTIIFIYQGGLCEGRGIEGLLDLFAQLSRDSNLACVFMGYGVLDKKIICYSKKYTNIFYHKAVPPSNLLDYTSSADIGLCLIENKCLSYYYCLPNKLFEYSMAGLPIIANDLPELRNVVTTYNTGAIVTEENLEEMIKVIKGITKKQIADWKKGLPDLVKEYNWENQESQLLKAYDK